MSATPNNLKSHRTARGWTQGELAEKAGTKQQQIQRIESGGSVKLPLATSIAAVLELPLVEVFPPALATPKLRAARHPKRDKFVSEMRRYYLDLHDSPAKWLIETLESKVEMAEDHMAMQAKHAQAEGPNAMAFMSSEVTSAEQIAHDKWCRDVAQRIRDLVDANRDFIDAAPELLEYDVETEHRIAQRERGFKYFGWSKKDHSRDWIAYIRNTSDTDEQHLLDVMESEFEMALDGMETDEDDAKTHGPDAIDSMMGASFREMLAHAEWRASMAKRIIRKLKANPNLVKDMHARGSQTGEAVQA